MDKGYWNYRVIRKQVEIDYYQYEIHEVYYDNDDAIWSWTEQPIAPFGESFLELKNDMNCMVRATQRPILEEKEIDGELRLVEIKKPHIPPIRVLKENGKKIGG